MEPKDTNPNKKGKITTFTWTPIDNQYMPISDDLMKLLAEAMNRMADEFHNECDLNSEDQDFESTLSLTELEAIDNEVSGEEIPQAWELIMNAYRKIEDDRRL